MNEEFTYTLYTGPVDNGYKLDIEGKTKTSKMKNEYLKDLADGFGSMNKVENKKNEKQPDYQGYFKADGKLFEIAGWVKISKASNKYLSIAVKEFKEKQTNNEL